MIPVRVNIRTDLPQALAVLRSTSAQAVARALNRTATTVQTRAARDISSDMALPVRRVRDAMAIKRATAKTLTAALQASGRRIPLIEFGARGPEPSRGRGRGVTYRLPGGRGHAPHAFIARMRSGHRGVFERRGKARLPIRELKGPSIPRVFMRDRIKAAMLATASAAMEKNLQHELDYALRRRGLA